MIEFLVRRFVKDYEHTENAQVRAAYGELCGMVGILCNALLFAGKLLAGLWFGSISVMADAFNNLSDAASSVIGFIGMRMASKPADRDHPFGHGRMEYVAALIVSFLVIEVGFSFFKNAIGRIREPGELSFQAVSLAVLAASVIVKLWLACLNRRLGRRIQSRVMLAAATDALGDVVTTSATVVSICVWRFAGINIDGYVGLAVSLVVMWAGVSIARDTLKPLLGEPVSPELYDSITRLVESHAEILGTHDLIVHNYGPTRSLASIHAEVSNHADIEAIHEVIDGIEREAARTLGIFLVIHMDPVAAQDGHVSQVRGEVAEIVRSLEAQASIHDFHMVEDGEHIHLIFDVNVPYEYSEEREQELQLRIMDEVQRLDPRYQCMLVVEKGYVAR